VSKIREIYEGAKIKYHRHKKGVGIGVAFAGISSAFLIPTQIALTAGVAEAVNHFGPTPLALLTYGLIALNTASIAVESATLARHNYSNNPPSSILNIMVKDTADRIPIIKDIFKKYPIIPAVFVSAVSHAYHLLPVGVMNPYLPSSIKSLISDDKRPFLENFGSISVALALWNIATNTLILRGSADKAAEKIIELGSTVKSKIKNKVNSLKIKKNP
jgi:hypothetical protein